MRRMSPAEGRCTVDRHLVVFAAIAVPAVAQSQQCGWEALEGATFSGTILALEEFNEGFGPRLFVGGTFSRLLGSPTSNLARWDSELWSQVGAGVNGSVYSLEVFDDGRGAALYAGGVFASAGGIPGAIGIARWNGREWSALGSGLYNENPGLTHNGAAMAVFDDGSGPSLYVGGSFTHVGGIPATNIARWDGKDWSAVGEGLEGHPGVRALAVYDDGSGPALYAGGYLVNGLSRWNGESWEMIDRDVGAVNTLIVFDDGTGPGLYAGGQFTTAGGKPAARIARYDSDWSPLGAGTDYEVRSLHVFDDGTGPALYAGPFPHPSGLEAGVARWDGHEWSAAGAALYHPRGISVDAMTTFDDGSGPALYVGGKFSEAGGIPVDNIARLRCATCYPDCDGSGQLDFFDFLCFQNQFAAQTPYADCDGSGSHDFFDFLCFQNEFAAGCP